MKLLTWLIGITAVVSLSIEAGAAIYGALTGAWWLTLLAACVLFGTVAIVRVEWPEWRRRMELDELLRRRMFPSRPSRPSRDTQQQIHQGIRSRLRSSTHLPSPNSHLRTSISEPRRPQ